MTHRRRVGRAGALADRVAVVAHRAPSSLPLLAAALAVVLAGTAVLGLCALLLTAGERATRDTALRAAPAATVDVRTSIGVVGGDPDALARTAQDVVAQRLPVPTTTTAWVTSSLRALPGEGTRMAYLAGPTADLADVAQLVTGRWPQPVPAGGAGGADEPVEAVLLTSTATLLDVRAGDEVPLATFTTAVAQPAGGPSADVVTVRVVGTVTARDDAASGTGGLWDADLLGGAGSAAEVGTPGTRGRVTLPAFGPFLVDGADLLTGAAGVTGLDLVTVPRLEGATAAELAATRAAVGGTRRAVAVALGADATDVRVASSVPATLADVAAQQSATRAGVQVAALVATALAAGALALAGRLVAGRRAAETALLAARGAAPSQLAGQAALESVAVAAVAAVLAVPLALAAYRSLTAVPGVAGSGLGTGATVDGPLVGTVVVGALLLAAVLAVQGGVAPAAGRQGRARRGDVVRSGVDVALVALAAAAVAAMRSSGRSTGGTTGGAVGGTTGGTAAGAPPDVVLVAAPVLCLLAGAAVALRVLPWVLHAADRRARGSRRLVGALAAWDLARRPQSAALPLLLVLATAAATFAAASGATWTASQRDQADARAGADLVLDATAVGPLEQGPAVAGLGGVATPVADVPVGVGRWRGDAVPRLVALDTSVAGDVLRGRLPTGSWGALVAGLGPDAPAGGPAVRLDADGGTGLVLTGTGLGDGLPLVATPTLVVEDAAGVRTALAATATPLDGTEHPVTLATGVAAEAGLAGRADASGPDGAVGTRLVALVVRLALADGAFVPPESAATERVQLTVAATGAAEDSAEGSDDGAGSDDGEGTDDGAGSDDAGSEGAAWTAARDRSGIGASSVTTSPAPDGVAVAATVTPGSLDGYGGPTELLLTAFAPPPVVPVVVTDDLASATSLRPGSSLVLTVGATDVAAEVAAVAPYVPSVPGGPGVLADRDVLGRALLAQGDTAPLADRWWVSAPTSADVPPGLTVVADRAATRDALLEGPLRVGVPVSLALVALAAVVLALAGVALHTTAAVEARALEVARLQGVGVPRRSVVAAVLLENAALTALVVALGALVGAGTAWAVGAALPTAPDGGAPVPSPVVVWPWPAEGALLAALALLPVLVVAPVAARLVRRATAAHLRLDGPT